MKLASISNSCPFLYKKNGVLRLLLVLRLGGPVDTGPGTATGLAHIGNTGVRVGSLHLSSSHLEECQLRTFYLVDRFEVGQEKAIYLIIKPHSSIGSRLTWVSWVYQQV